MVGALLKDGWIREEKSGSILVYFHPLSRKRVAIHYHPHKTYGPKLLKALLEDIGWSEVDIRRLKLVK